MSLSPTVPAETVAIRAGEDVVRVRQVVRDHAVRLGFTLIEQTKLVTAASELARNTLEHGRGGEVMVEDVVNGGRLGIRLTFEDQGPGIPDIALALKDGYTTGGGLGLGLGGAKRLVGDLQVESVVGKGTRVRATRWK
jgi:serine/threonine-protein kinase RsbT